MVGYTSERPGGYSARTRVRRTLSTVQRQSRHEAFQVRAPSARAPNSPHCRRQSRVYFVLREQAGRGEVVRMSGSDASKQLESSISDLALALFAPGTVEGTLQGIVDLAVVAIDGC